MTLRESEERLPSICNQHVMTRIEVSRDHFFPWQVFSVCCLNCSAPERKRISIKEVRKGGEEDGEEI